MSFNYIDLTSFEYDDIVARLSKEDGDHWICKSYLMIRDKKYSPATICRLLYKYNFPEVDLNDKHKICKSTLDYGTCVNPDHVEYVTEDRRREYFNQKNKENRLKEKQRREQDAADGYKYCIACGTKYKSIDSKYSNTCSVKCMLIFRSLLSGPKSGLFGYLKEGEYRSFNFNENNCWISSFPEIREKSWGSIYRPQSLHDLVLLAIQEDFDNRGEECTIHKEDPELVMCPEHEHCINPYHYVAISPEEKIQRTNQNEQLEIIEQIPLKYQAGFKKWHCNNLFAKISEALVSDDTELAEKMLSKLTDLDSVFGDDRSCGGQVEKYKKTLKRISF